MKLLLKKNEKGFGLLGVIVAMYLLLISVVPLLSLMLMINKASLNSKAKIVATGLAQEGIEVVRNTRRSYFNWNDWYNNISDGDYEVQYNDSALSDMDSYTGSNLKRDSDNLYQYSNGDDTYFSRKITINKISAEEVEVVSEVSWDLKGRSYSLKAQTSLWNWK